MKQLKISESSLTHVMFDVLQSQIQVIRDEPRRHMIKQTFNDFLKAGNRLWKEQGKIVEKLGQTENFEFLSIAAYEALRELFSCSDMPMMLALMKSFNNNEIRIEDELPEGIKTERQLAELSVHEQ